MKLFYKYTVAKAGIVDHIRPVSLPLSYLFKHQEFNSCERWSRQLAFPL